MQGPGGGSNGSAHGSTGSAGSGSLRMIRISGPGDLLNGAGHLLAAGARQVQGVRTAFQPSQARQHISKLTRCLC